MKKFFGRFFQEDSWKSNLEEQSTENPKRRRRKRDILREELLLDKTFDRSRSKSIENMNALNFLQNFRTFSFE